MLGVDVFARGAPEDFTETDRSKLSWILAGCSAPIWRRGAAPGPKLQYRPKPMVFFSVQNALERLQRMVGSKPDWSSLDAFLPQGLGEGLPRRAALSATLIAGLEMTKGGRLELKQEQIFGPIMLRAIERDETATDLEDEDGRD